MNSFPLICGRGLNRWLQLATIVSAFYQATCDDPCGVCTLTPNVVCAIGPQGEAINYLNPCFVTCLGATLLCDHNCPCSQPLTCKEECGTGDPLVCGTDGNTHGGACQAQCDGVDVACAGVCPCPPPVPSCEEQNCGSTPFSPVCSEEGKTYDNHCLATCDMAKISCNQECPCPAVQPEECPSGYEKVLYGGECKCYTAYLGSADEYQKACKEPGQSRLSGRDANEVRAVEEAINSIRMAWTEGRYRKNYGRFYTWENGDRVPVDYRFKPNLCVVRIPGSGELRRRTCRRPVAHIVCSKPCQTPN